MTCLSQQADAPVLDLLKIDVNDVPLSHAAQPDAAVEASNPSAGESHAVTVSDSGNSGTMSSTSAGVGSDASAGSSGSNRASTDTWKKGLGGYLDNSSYGKFLRAMESAGLSDAVPQELPCIVVIGEESSGKSATLER